MVEIIIAGSVAIGAAIGFAFGNARMKRKLEALQDEYNTLVDRDPKTGRFVKSMRKLKND